MINELKQNMILQMGDSSVCEYVPNAGAILAICFNPDTFKISIISLFLRQNTLKT